MFDLPAVQSALRRFGLDGWLLAEFRGSNVLARRVLGLDGKGLTSRRLFYFYHVARMRSFSAAEAIVDIAQPAISRQIQQLETDLGVQLLERNGRGVSLTQYGDILYRKATAILEEMSATLEEIENARRRPAGQISIAASAGIIAPIIPSADNIVRCGKRWRINLLIPTRHCCLPLREANPGRPRCC